MRRELGEGRRTVAVRKRAQNRGRKFTRRQVLKAAGAGALVLGSSGLLGGCRMVPVKKPAAPRTASSPAPPKKRWRLEFEAVPKRLSEEEVGILANNVNWPEARASVESYYAAVKAGMHSRRAEIKVINEAERAEEARIGKLVREASIAAKRALASRVIRYFKLVRSHPEMWGVLQAHLEIRKGVYDKAKIKRMEERIGGKMTLDQRIDLEKHVWEWALVEAEAIIRVFDQRYPGLRGGRPSPQRESGIVG